MKPYINKVKFQQLSELLVLTVFTLGLVYIFDDVIQVIAVKGIFAEIAFYTFFAGPFFTLPLSLLCWKKLKGRRFVAYTAISVIQLLLIATFTYIIMNSQV